MRHGVKLSVESTERGEQVRSYKVAGKCRVAPRASRQIQSSSKGEFLSNHSHLLLESEDVHALSQFVQYLKSNLSRELARENDW